MRITSFDLQLEGKNSQSFNVKKSIVNYWGSIVKAAGSTHSLEHSSYLNSASNSHTKQITLYYAMYIRKL